MAAIFFLAGYSTVKNRNGESKEGQTKAQSLQSYLEQNKQLYTACWPEREVEWRGTYVNDTTNRRKSGKLLYNNGYHKVIRAGKKFCMNSE